MLTKKIANLKTKITIQIVVQFCFLSCGSLKITQIIIYFFKALALWADAFFFCRKSSLAVPAAMAAGRDKKNA